MNLIITESSWILDKFSLNAKGNRTGLVLQTRAEKYEFCFFGSGYFWKIEVSMSCQRKKPGIFTICYNHGLSLQKKKQQWKKDLKKNVRNLDSNPSPNNLFFTQNKNSLQSTLAKAFKGILNGELSLNFAMKF